MAKPFYLVALYTVSFLVTSVSRRFIHTSLSKARPVWDQRCRQYSSQLHSVFSSTRQPWNQIPSWSKNLLPSAPILFVFVSNSAWLSSPSLKLQIKLNAVHIGLFCLFQFSSVRWNKSGWSQSQSTSKTLLFLSDPVFVTLSNILGSIYL